MATINFQTILSGTTNTSKRSRPLNSLHSPKVAASSYYNKVHLLRKRIEDQIEAERYWPHISYKLKSDGKYVSETCGCSGIHRKIDELTENTPIDFRFKWNILNEIKDRYTCKSS